LAYYLWFSLGSLFFLGLLMYTLIEFFPYTTNGITVGYFDLIVNLGFPLLAVVDLLILIGVFYASPVEVEGKSRGYGNEWIWPSIPLAATVVVVTIAWFKGQGMIALSYYYVPFILGGLAILRSWVAPKLQSSESQTSSETTGLSST
jgi:hypothetical protein